MPCVRHSAAPCAPNFHSRAVAKVLKKAKKDYEFLEFDQEIHGFLIDAKRIRFARALAEFFQ